MNIQSITIDSTNSVSELCYIGGAVGTDKSPYNKVAHRHPYTSVYSMLFSPLKGKPITFAEIGVAGGHSAILWDVYFKHPETKIYMFDRDANFLRNADRITGSRVICKITDVRDEECLEESFGDMEYDVIVDDSSHEIEDQIRIIRTLFPKVKSGGFLIIEDVFREKDEKEYQDQLVDIIPQCSAAYFVVCEHKDRWSPGWNNDKLLVLVKA